MIRAILLCLALAGCATPDCKTFSIRALIHCQDPPIGYHD